MEDINFDKKYLENIGFEKSLINKVYSFLRPISIEQAIEFMTIEDGKYQHNFYSGNKSQDNICYICGEPPFCHINYSPLSDGNLSEFKNNDIIKNEKDLNINNNILIECKICGESYPEKNFIKHDKCKESYCKDCWMNYIRGKIDNGTVEKIACMNFKCESFLSKEFILSIIKDDTNLVLKYDKFIQRLEILNAPNKKFCPYPSCESFAEESKKSKIVKCKNGHKFCFLCLKNHEENEKCDEEMDKDFKIWMKNRIVKRCPKCRLWTEKNEGCNHMTCSQCKTQWCWLCGNLYDNLHFRKGKCRGLQFQTSVKTEDDILKIFQREVIITNLSFNTDVKKLSDYLKRFGTINDIYILKDKKTGKSKGIAFCKFLSENDSKKAVQQKDHVLDGKKLTIRYSNDNSYKNTSNNKDKNEDISNNNNNKNKEEKKQWEICVKGIPDETNYELIHNLFKKYGEISDDFLLNKKGIYFCTFNSKQIAENLVKMGIVSFSGKNLKIKYSHENMNKPKEEKNLISHNIDNNNKINLNNNNKKINPNINNKNNIQINNNTNNKIKENKNSSNNNKIINNNIVNPPKKYTLFVGNISYESTESDLKNFFQGCGNVAVRIITANGKSKGYGYADFDSLENMNKALLKNRQLLNSRPLKLDIEVNDKKPHGNDNSRHFHKKHEQ